LAGSSRMNFLKTIWRMAANDCYSSHWYRQGLTGKNRPVANT
jgi:hypothetical protein